MVCFSDKHFKHEGFERWQKIYGETDDVNPVQKAAGPHQKWLETSHEHGCQLVGGTMVEPRTSASDTPRLWTRSCDGWSAGLGLHGARDHVFRHCFQYRLDMQPDLILENFVPVIEQKDPNTISGKTVCDAGHAPQTCSTGWQRH